MNSNNRWTLYNVQEVTLINLLLWVVTPFHFCRSQMSGNNEGQMALTCFLLRLGLGKFVLKMLFLNDLLFPDCRSLMSDDLFGLLFSSLILGTYLPNLLIIMIYFGPFSTFMMTVPRCKCVHLSNCQQWHPKSEKA